ncbi:TPA: hypothetical protein ACHX6U_005304, partial [Escherichia coli]
PETILNIISLSASGPPLSPVSNNPESKLLLPPTRQKATIRFTICDTDRLPAYCNFSTATGGHLSTKNLHSGGK